MLKLKFVFILLLVCLAGLRTSFGQDGGPVAIRHWTGGGYTIENMWGLVLEMGVDAEVLSKLDRKPDLRVSNIEIGKGKSITRLPNMASVSISEFSPEDLNGIHVMRASHKEGAMKNPPTVVFAGGNLIINLSGVSAAEMVELAEIKEIGLEFGVSPVIVATHTSHDKAFCEKIFNVIHPRLLIVRSGIEEVAEVEVVVVPHNTLAISVGEPDVKDKKIVSLGTTPYEMSDEVADLFAKKEASQKKSREMFAKLSVEQMNFKPANGSHTPRWNTEHMMGRELGFFSEIYHAVDPSIPVMNLNPKQMPKDYKFAHPDWTGAEEARQMKRVENFTRRFAYLLDGMDLDKRAKGSRFWTPRKLLAQMERHYKEHSDNVVKKMELDGWPKE